MSEETVTLEALEDTIGLELLVPGKHCLIHFADNTFLVQIAEVEDDSIRVTFHAYDFPVPGMLIDLEFHEPIGIVRYITKVLKGPKKDGDGIVMEMPFKPRIVQHRATFRAKTRIKAVMRPQGIEGETDCLIKNLSTTGALMESSTQLSSRSTLELDLALSEGSPHILQAEVCHVAEITELSGGKTYIYGIRFTDFSPGAGSAVTNYIWDRLKELYPSVAP